MRHDGTQVKLQRERMELTKTELGRRIGVSPMSVLQYERAITLRESVIKKLQTVFGEDWSPDGYLYAFPQGVDKVTKLLAERGVKLTVENNCIYFTT